MGGLAATFIVADGGSVGESRVEEGAIDDARALLEKSRGRNRNESAAQNDSSSSRCGGGKREAEEGQGRSEAKRPRIASISLPVDAVAAKSLSAEDAAAAVVVPAAAVVVPAGAVPPGLSAFDAGPETVAAVKALVESAGTVVWNGPAGVFEVPPFGRGTREIAAALAALSGRVETIVGGGHSVAAVNEAGLADKFGHVSTGGGASLELLEGRVLPGWWRSTRRLGSPGCATRWREGKGERKEKEKRRKREREKRRSMASLSLSLSPLSLGVSLFSRRAALSAVWGRAVKLRETFAPHVFEREKKNFRSFVPPSLFRTRPDRSFIPLSLAAPIKSHAPLSAQRVGHDEPR